MNETGFWNECVICKNMFPVKLGEDWGLKNWKCPHHEGKTDEELIEELIEDLRKKKILAQIREYGWTGEAVKPQKVGKNEALERLGIAQKEISLLKKEIEGMKLYRKEKYGK